MTALDGPPGALPRELECAAGALAWAGGLLGPDGSFAGAEDSVGAYYLAPLAFANGGRIDRANLICEYVRERFYRDGDINERAGEPASQVANFRNAFLGVSAQRVGVWDMAIAIADGLERRQHPQLGGFANHNIDDATRALDIGSSAAALICLLTAGRIGAARRAGDFICEQMINTQPQPERRVLLRRTWDGDWITDFSESEAARHQIELGVSGQIYWFLGITMAALGQLYLASGENHYLQSARRVFGWVLDCHPGSFADLTAAKVGWGASVMYAATREEQFAVRSRYVSHVLCATRLPEGVWLRRPAVTKLADQDVATSLDTTLERVCWLIEMTRNVQLPQGGSQA
jgi:hypothetical protein